MLYIQLCVCCFCFFVFKQKTAYEMRISDWSSDVCSSDLMSRMTLCRRSPTPALKAIIVAPQITPRMKGRTLMTAPTSWLYAPPTSRASVHQPESARSEERRVGKERVSTCRSRWSPYHSKKTKCNTTFTHHHSP